MYEACVILDNKTGLHARPAAELVRESSQYRSEIFLDPRGRDIAFNAKSILDVVGAGIHSGAEVTLKVDGPDEKEAGPAIRHLLETLPE